jgi:cytochrome c553
MRRTWINLIVAAVAVAAVLYALAGPAASEETQRAYVGVAKCKTCHKTDAQGLQFPQWEKSSHAKAYATLAGEKAKAIAKEKGIEDPQKADACLKCHTTGHGVDAKFLGEGFLATDGVQCEACHGAGGDSYKMATMKSLTKGEIEPAAVGLVLPTAELCVKCHNKESPTFKEFEFAKMAPKIAHPIPAERKAQYKTE